MEPEIIAVTYPWAGFYGGISGGYGTSTSIDPRFQNNGYESVAEGQVVETPVANWYNFNACFEDAPSGWGNGSFDYCGDSGDADGWFGGGQVGYNWQSSDWVFGLEADAFFSNIEGSADSFWEYEFLNGNVGSTATSIDYEIEAFGTIRGRIGYAMDRFLPYITGGAAWASVDVSGESFNINSAAPNTSFSASDSGVEWGWALGAGAEYLITDNLSIKGEYVYMDFGSHQANFTYSDGGAYNFESDLDIHTVKIGLNYHFN
jgi:outer membrane immunogenic protein